MPERQNKLEKESLVEVDTEEVSFILEPTQVEVGLGYTISIDYDEDEKPVIDVKTYGEVDTAKLRREIQRLFPNAKIRKMNQTGSVTVVKKRTVRSPAKDR